MALNLSQPPPPLTIFSPQTPTPRKSTTELRFSRWNNANAQKFIQKQRAQQEIEDDIRRDRRFTSATKITENYNPTPSPNNENFKSIGTPSSPSRSSIPGKKSKYSKPHQNPNPKPSHPAFSKVFRTPKFPVSRVPNESLSGIQVGDNGVSYKVPNAPFEFQYSYTETPKVKPLALREPPFVPFGPTTMPRPWTGRAPLPPSKKQLPEFDSFKLPPPGKKGVKPVQAPGPFLAGMGPRYVKSREEVLGDPLTDEEIKELVQSCLRTRRQLNMGRDGLTHNMLDNIHSHWKRRRVCKIKCLGVCTVDMDNVRYQLEEKTGGKIIYSRGGILFLFRGRNYNYRSRPRYPLMLWKPITPVYPRLIQQVPEGLTLDEAKDMRKRGRELTPICKLGKNNLYAGLVKHVREAFEACELVRINCEGMNGSDYKKIGAKLKDLVPCVLISFEYEHILMWRGRDWVSSLPKLEESAADGAIISPPNCDNEEALWLLAQNSSEGEDVNFKGNKDAILSASEVQSSSVTSMEANESSIISHTDGSTDDQAVASPLSPHDILHHPDVESKATSSSTCTEGVIQLQKKAFERGSAFLLDDTSLDADTVFQRSVAFSKRAPLGPVFRSSIKKVLIRKLVKKENSDLEEREVITVTQEVVKKRTFRNRRLNDIKEGYPDTLPYGSLGVDQLAKLLG